MKLEAGSYTTEQYLRELVGECQRSLLEEINELKTHAIAQEKKYEKLKKTHNDLVEIVKILIHKYENHKHDVYYNEKANVIDFCDMLSPHENLVLESLTIKFE